MKIFSDYTRRKGTDCLILSVRKVIRGAFNNHKTVDLRHMYIYIYISPAVQSDAIKSTLARIDPLMFVLDKFKIKQKRERENESGIYSMVVCAACVYCGSARRKK